MAEKNAVLRGLLLSSKDTKFPSSPPDKEPESTANTGIDAPAQEESPNLPTEPKLENLSLFSIVTLSSAGAGGSSTSLVDSHSSHCAISPTVALTDEHFLIKTESPESHTLSHSEGTHEVYTSGPTVFPQNTSLLQSANTHGVYTSGPSMYPENSTLIQSADTQEIYTPGPTVYPPGPTSVSSPIALSPKDEGLTSPVDPFPNLWSTVGPSSPLSPFPLSTSTHINSPTYPDGALKADNFLVNQGADSQDSVRSQTLSVPQSAFSPLGLGPSDFISQAPEVESPSKLDRELGSISDQAMTLGSDFILPPTTTQSVAFCGPALSPTFSSASGCASTFDVFTLSPIPTSRKRSNSSRSSPQGSPIPTGAKAKKVSRSQSSSRSVLSPRQFLDDTGGSGSDSSSNSHHSHSSIRTFAGRNMEDNGMKSDSGLGDSGSDSQQSPLSYASLTPWTTKLLAPDYVPSPPLPTTCQSLPLHLSSSSMFSISPGVAKTTSLHFGTSSRTRNFSQIQVPLKPCAQVESVSSVSTKKVADDSSSKTELKNRPNKEHRFKRTAEALQNSGLWEVAMRTGNLIKRNKELQKELDQFRLNALGFLKSVIKNPQNRSYIRSVLNNALISGGPRTTKSPIMSVVVSAAAAAVKLETTPTTVSASQENTRVSPSPSVVRNSPEQDVERNFLGVEARTKSKPMG